MLPLGNHRVMGIDMVKVASHEDACALAAAVGLNDESTILFPRELPMTNSLDHVGTAFVTCALKSVQSLGSTHVAG